MSAQREEIGAETLPRADSRGRRLPVGAEVSPGGGVHFRVWAPEAERVSVVLAEEPTFAAGRSTALEREPGGYFSGWVGEAAAGTLYRYRLGGEDLPDPASRFQPLGPHGPSQVVDPAAFAWSDEAWRGIPRHGQVIYELHVGTFAGGFRAARERLGHLADLGVAVIELMPVAEFPGRFGWGYDGVGLFAPTRLYGAPDDFRAFVDAAHGRGIGVILDVVYNHLGPDGNYLKAFAADYFTDRYQNEWGEAVNFDGPDCGPVREFFTANAGYWIDEFHLDGLRLDATQQIFDDSPEHILKDMEAAVRSAGGRRQTYLVAENEPQETRLVRPRERGGYGLDALWNDDFHHSAVVALTGNNEAYYSDYLGSPQEFVSAAKYGYLFQGQRYRWQKKRRGAPAFDLEPERFVTFIQNHDQVANSLHGYRAHELGCPGMLRAMTALLLLGPGTPMLFQGQEFAASTPFLYFADHKPELAKLVATGRREFLEQFPCVACPDSAKYLRDPADEGTFRSCVLDFADAERNANVLALHRDLIALRRGDAVATGAGRRGIDGAVLGPESFLLRYFGVEAGDDRLLLVNFGRRQALEPAPEPLLAPPDGREWRQRWGSEDARYGGDGMRALGPEEPWRVPARTAVWLAAEREETNHE